MEWVSPGPWHLQPTPASIRPRAARLTGQVQCHQRGGAPRIYGHRRALETKRVGDPAGDDAGRGARYAKPFWDSSRRSPGWSNPRTPRLGCRSARRGRCQRSPSPPPRRFRAVEAVLRIHRQRLARADPEEGRVEARGVVQEPPSACGSCAPARAGSVSYSASRSQPRSEGNSEIASTPETTRSHRSAAERTPPG